MVRGRRGFLDADRQDELKEVTQRYGERARGRKGERARGRKGESKTIPHPSLGPIDVHAHVPFTENRAQTLVVLTARPGTESQGKLELLSAIGHQQLMP